MPSTLTPEEKKAKRAATNRANAQKSTGPRTPEGKARARHNSLKHGRRAHIIDYSETVNTVVLPGEPMAAYVGSVEALVAKLAPRDEVELELVHRVAAAQWEIRRFRSIRLILLEDQFQTVELKLKHNPLPECPGALYLARAYQLCTAPSAGKPGSTSLNMSPTLRTRLGIPRPKAQPGNGIHYILLNSSTELHDFACTET